jgi:hypothetical protein
MVPSRYFSAGFLSAGFLSTRFLSTRFLSTGFVYGPHARFTWFVNVVVCRASPPVAASELSDESPGFMR